MPNLDSGVASLRTGSRLSLTIHLMNPPDGQGTLCNPTISIDRLVAQPADARPNCGRCLMIARTRK